MEPFLVRRENVARYEGGVLSVLDRRRYPLEVSYVSCSTVEEVARAIEDMVTQSTGPAVVAGDRTVRGSYMGSSTPRRDIARLLAMYETGRLPVGELVADTVALDDVPRGMRELENGVPGRIMVDLAAD